MYQSSKVKYLIGKKFSEQGNNLLIKLVGWNLVIEEGYYASRVKKCKSASRVKNPQGPKLDQVGPWQSSG